MRKNTINFRQEYVILLLMILIQSPSIKHKISIRLKTVIIKSVSSAEYKNNNFKSIRLVTMANGIITKHLIQYSEI